MFTLFLLWFISLFVVVLNSRYLLPVIVALEILTFFSIYIMIYITNPYAVSDLLVIIFFSVFVMEGVMALAGIIMLVSFSGTDYLSSSSISNC